MNHYRKAVILENEKQKTICPLLVAARSISTDSIESIIESGCFDCIGAYCSFYVPDIVNERDREILYVSGCCIPLIARGLYNAANTIKEHTERTVKSG